MKRYFVAALALACLYATPAEARRSADLSREFTGDRYSGGAPAVDTQRAVKRTAKKTYRKAKRSTRLAARTPTGYAKHIARTASRDLTGFPEPLVIKVRELERECGSKVVSGYRPGARIGRSGVMSNHARRKAVDMSGNPACMYAHLKGWPGGVSTDYHSAPGGKHVHISYNPGGMEWGVRFAHRGKYKSGTRYASRRHRYATAGGG